MNQPIYEIQFSDFDQIYTFISEGKQGKILKMVRFQEIDESMFNLGFGDFIQSTSQVDDKIVSNNGDMVKVLATVLEILDIFLNENPEVSVFITGSSPSRVRLYQIAITTNFSLLSKKYLISGFREDDWEDFQKNIPYEAFLVQKLF
jgi:hypothetical protein